MQSFKKRFLNTHEDYFISAFKFPNARINEFKNFRRISKRSRFKKILEFPADGEMLNTIYPLSVIERAELLDGDYEKLYRHKIKITSYSLNKIKNDFYDAILGVTPLHHASNKQQSKLVEMSFHKLNHKGILIFADVLKNSKEALFLDEFIDKNSTNGHRGNYPDLNFIKILKKHGYSEVEAKLYSCAWIFQSEKEMCIFCRKIFGLTNISNDFLLSNLMSYLGYKKYNKKIYLDWNLIYFIGLKS